MLHHISGQAEITHLHQLPLTHQDVPRCQVSVDTLQHACHNATLHNIPRVTRQKTDNRSYISGGEEVHGL